VRVTPIQTTAGVRIAVYILAFRKGDGIVPVLENRNKEFLSEGIYCFVFIFLNYPTRTSNVLSAILCSVICGLSGLACFSYLPRKPHDFRENVFNVNCVLSYSYNFCLKILFIQEEFSVILS
jgi:hypothetical protein